MLIHTNYKILSFDCYGTLIDWEAGILSALTPVLNSFKVEFKPDQLLELYAELESDLERKPFRRYSKILTELMDNVCAHFNITTNSKLSDTLLNSLPDWTPFSDTNATLRELKRHYKLAVISNIDDDLFAEKSKRLEVDFDFIITAKQVKAYKPSPRVFEQALEITGCQSEELLHIAQSLYHDIAPTNKLGINNVLVNRRHGKPGSGATPEEIATPDMEVRNLSELIHLLC